MFLNFLSTGQRMSHPSPIFYWRHLHPHILAIELEFLKGKCYDLFSFAWSVHLPSLGCVHNWWFIYFSSVQKFFGLSIPSLNMWLWRQCSSFPWLFLRLKWLWPLGATLEPFMQWALISKSSLSLVSSTLANWKGLPRFSGASMAVGLIPLCLPVWGLIVLVSHHPPSQFLMSNPHRVPHLVACHLITPDLPSPFALSSSYVWWLIPLIHYSSGDHCPFQIVTLASCAQCLSGLLHQSPPLASQNIFTQSTSTQPSKLCFSPRLSYPPTGF